MNESRYLPHFDGIRGLAILGVFMFHCMHPALSEDTLGWNGWFWDVSKVDWSRALLLPLSYGGTRVAIFFVLSGFCVYVSYFHARDRSWSLFATKRFFRIFPPYILAFCLFFFVWPWGRFSIENPYRVLQFATHLPAVHNVHADSLFGVNPSFWTIAVEVQLYALFPLLLWIQRRWGWKNTLCGLGALELAIRSLSVLHDLGVGPRPPTIVAFSPFAFWMSWSLGAYAASCYVNNRPSLLARIRFDVVLVLAIVMPPFKPTAPLAFPVFALAAAIMVDRLRTGAWTIPERVTSHRIWSHLSFLGVMSYSFYLLHQPMIELSMRVLERLVPHIDVHPMLRMLVCSTTYVPILAASYVFFRLIEGPSIELGKTWWKFVKNRARRAADSAAQLLAKETLELAPAQTEEAKTE